MDVHWKGEEIGKEDESMQEPCTCMHKEFEMSAKKGSIERGIEHSIPASQSPNRRQAIAKLSHSGFTG